jgi:hypothetical protein
VPPAWPRATGSSCWPRPRRTRPWPTSPSCSKGASPDRASVPRRLRLRTSQGDFLRRWSAASSSSQIDVLTSGGRFGDGAIRIRGTSGEETLTKNLTAPYPATLIVGAAVLLEPESTAGTSGEYEILRLLDSAAVVHFTLTWSNQDQLLRVYRGTQTGTLLATANQLLGAALWTFLEVKATVADNGGVVQARLDGTQVLGFTGDTRNAGIAEFATVRFSNHFVGSGTRHLLRLDDVYLCDTAGSRNNDFLGDVRVVTLRPNADTPQADFTPSAGRVRYSLLAEAPDDDGDATYVESGTVGHKDLYGYQDLTGTPAAIMAVQGSRRLRLPITHKWPLRWPHRA